MAITTSSSMSVKPARFSVHIRFMEASPIGDGISESIKTSIKQLWAWTRNQSAQPRSSVTLDARRPFFSSAGEGPSWRSNEGRLFVSGLTSAVNKGRSAAGVATLEPVAGDVVELHPSGPDILGRLGGAGLGTGLGRLGKRDRIVWPLDQNRVFAGRRSVAEVAGFEREFPGPVDDPCRDQALSRPGTSALPVEVDNGTLRRLTLVCDRAVHRIEPRADLEQDAEIMVRKTAADTSNKRLLMVLQ